MHNTAQMFIDELNAKDLKFTVREVPSGEVVLSIVFDSKNTNFIFSGEKGEYVSMYTLFEHVPADKITDLLLVCNSLNTQLKWFKFYIDDDNDLMIQDDAIITPETAAAECFELLARRVNIMKEVKPTIMRAIYT